ncbi:MAG: aminopeptidase [Eubacteriales bacterium]
MKLSAEIITENEDMKERYELSIERIQSILKEETVEESYREYFNVVSHFILLIDEVKMKIESGEWESSSLETKKSINERLYQDILGESYQASYANPQIACETFGMDLGRLLALLYTEIRGEIPYVFELRTKYLTICNELFIQVYNCFEDKTYEDVQEIIYWYASDYSDIFVADRIVELVDTSYSFARNIIETADLNNVSYLYDFGEFISENEIRTAQYLQALPEETVELMAQVYVNGYKNGFVSTGKDLSIKSIVNVRYVLGFELVVRRALELFADLGLTACINRSAFSVITKKQNIKLGFYGASANKQYEYDHKDDQALILDKKLVERKLEVTSTTYEDYATAARGFAGPAVIEVFGEKQFVPIPNKYAPKLSEKQEKMSLQYDSKSGQLVNKYIHGEERSFTIVAYPVSEIGEKYEEIFTEIIKINTLDCDLYDKVQLTIIDALDQGEYVRVVGKGANKTHLNIQLKQVEDPERETIFESCVADVNIPVGEVFTSPMLKGTFGTLHVSKVYLHELEYKNIEFTLEDGYAVKYNCTNFEDDEANKNYVKENVMHNHGKLPLGEFAIGTNTTAYVTAKKYGIEDKMPILIAEKMGPHFALGDTCYSWCEDIRVYNANGKEIVVKDNELSILRKEDVSKAYVNCHTDVTIPYEELKEITVVTAKGEEIKIVEDGYFVLPGTDILNEPFKDL